jgi:hypothetical protein
MKYSLMIIMDVNIKDTNCMEHSPSCEADSNVACQEISRIFQAFYCTLD